MSTTRHTTTTRNVKQLNPNAAQRGSSTSSNSSPSTMPSRPRKLSSRSQKEARVSRKLSKRAEQSGKAPLVGEVRANSSTQDVESKRREKEESIPQEIEQQQQQQPRPVPARSIIPDTLVALPSWYSTDVESAATSTAQFRRKYPLQNPVGPRYYKNHHLFPPSLEKRPPSVFSPSFPPMTTSTERLPDTAKIAGPSRSSSGSPTPSSSQVRIHDVRVRTRKISQEHAETLSTDPWSSNLHDRSPYDVGKSKDHASDSLESPTFPVRPRRMSMTTMQRHKTTVPSPLSQSTSAVHLASEPLSTLPPRRLSKRRKTLRGLFRSDRENRPFMSRGVSSPLEHEDVSRQLGRKESRTGSMIAPSTASVTAIETSTRRQSILGRLVKRFSIVRRSEASKLTKSSFPSFRQSTELDSGLAISPISPRSDSPDKSHLTPTQPKDAHRRVPVPAEDMNADKHGDLYSKDDAESLMSVDNRYSMGKLMVANPDDSGSDLDLPERGNRPQGHAQDGDMPFSTSPEPLSYSPPQPPFFGHPIRGPLSVISEGETYMSSPRMQPEQALEESPRTPPTIPSLLSLPARSAALPMDHVVQAASPPLPDLPLPSGSLPEIPTAPSMTSVVSPPAPISAPAPSTVPAPAPSVSSAPVPRKEASLPPTPEGSRVVTPPMQEPKFELQVERKLEPSAIDPTTDRTPRPKPQSLSQSDPSNARSFSTPPQRPIHRTLSSNTTDTSILARASLIVNPPTPQAPSIAIPPSTSQQPTAVSISQDEPKSPTRDESPTKKDGSRRMRSKHTETFKLVRTPSGNVQPVGNSFVADGEHWHVVESPKEETSRKSRRERESSDDRDRSSRRKSKRAEREGASEDSDQQRAREQTGSPERGLFHGDGERLSSNPHRYSDDSHKRSSAPDGRRSHRDTQHDVARATQTPITHSSKSYVPSSSPWGANVERRTSTTASTRPSSDFQSVADINTLKATDAWEIERMWKGRSMIYAPNNMHVNGNHRHHISSDSRPTTIMSHDLHRASTIPSVGDAAQTTLSTYGSSHTSFTLATPPHSPQHAASYPRAAPVGTTRQPATFTLPLLPPLSSSPPNPLPEPPRISSYKPVPFPLALGGTGEGTASTKYWNRHASVTVSH